MATIEPPLHVQFDEKQMAAISEIASRLGVSSTAVIGMGLYILQLAAREKEKGHTLAIADSERKVLKEIKI